MARDFWRGHLVATMEAGAAAGTGVRYAGPLRKRLKDNQNKERDKKADAKSKVRWPRGRRQQSC